MVLVVPHLLGLAVLNLIDTVNFPEILRRIPVFSFLLHHVRMLNLLSDLHLSRLMLMDESGSYLAIDILLAFVALIFLLLRR